MLPSISAMCWRKWTWSKQEIHETQKISLGLPNRKTAIKCSPRDIFFCLSPTGYLSDIFQRRNLHVQNIRLSHDLPCGFYSQSKAGPCPCCTQPLKVISCFATISGISSSMFCPSKPCSPVKTVPSAKAPADTTVE